MGGVWGRIFYGIDGHSIDDVHDDDNAVLFDATSEIVIFALVNTRGIQDQTVLLEQGCFNSSGRN